MYGENMGATSHVCSNKDEADRCQSQIKIRIGPMYSNPAIHGAHLVHEILGDARSLNGDGEPNDSQEVKGAAGPSEILTFVPN